MNLLLIILSILSLFLQDEPHMDIQKVNFQEDKTSIMRNPCMGWGLYDDADGAVQQADDYWNKQDEAAKKYASFFYVRWRWSEMEPEEGQYAWIYNENYKKLIQGALDRGLKLCFRIYNHSQDNLNQSTPDYVRKAGAKGFIVNGMNGQKLWTPYPDDPIFQAKLKKFVKAFSAEYDNPALVDFVDAYNIGWWGECHNIQLSGNTTNDKLRVVLNQITDIYSTQFKRVMLVLPFNSQVGFEAEKEIAIDSKGYSMRRDGLGSMWFTDKEQKIAQDMYGKTLLIGESCWWKSCSDSVRPWASDKKYKLTTWRDVYELTYKHAVDGHFNTLDLREIPETTGWTTRAQDLVESFCIKGGYRIHPTEIVYNSSIKQGDRLSITHSWVNTGAGYLPNNVKNWNYKYKPAFALIDTKGNLVSTYVDKDSEPSSWLTNQKHTYSFKADICDLQTGQYQLVVAIVDTTNNNEPAIHLAIENARKVKGWYLIGTVDIHER